MLNGSLQDHLYKILDESVAVLNCHHSLVPCQKYLSTRIESLVAALNEGVISKEDEPSINHQIEDDLHLEGDECTTDCDDDEEPTALNISGATLEAFLNNLSQNSQFK